MSNEAFAEATPLIVLLAVLVLLSLALLPAAKGDRRPRRTQYRVKYPSSTWKNSSDAWRTPAPIEPARTQNAAEQLQIVMKAEFTARSLLNKSEARVFHEICEILAQLKPGWRVMAQVSLGETLRSRDTEAFRCINAKRVDMLIVDEECRPRCAIEYQGSGHYRGTAAARDAVKKEALRRAGIDYREVIAGKTTAPELRKFLENLLR